MRCIFRFQSISSPSFVNLRRKSPYTDIWHETKANVPCVSKIYNHILISDFSNRYVSKTKVIYYADRS